MIEDRHWKDLETCSLKASDFNLYMTVYLSTDDVKKMSEREKLFFIGVPLVEVSYLVDTFKTLPTTALRDYLKKYDEQFYSRYRIFF